MTRDLYAMPDGLLTENPQMAAEAWADAFYRAKDALKRIRPVPGYLLQGIPVRDLDEILVECDSIIHQVGED